MVAKLLEPFSDEDLIKIISEDSFPYNAMDEDINLHKDRPYLSEVAVKCIKDTSKYQAIITNAKNLVNPFALFAIYQSSVECPGIEPAIVDLADQAAVPFIREQAILALPEQELNYERLSYLLNQSQSLDIKRKALLTMYTPGVSYLHCYKNEQLTDSEYDNFLYKVNYNQIINFVDFEAFPALYSDPKLFPDSIKTKIKARWMELMAKPVGTTDYRVILLDPVKFKTAGGFREGLAPVKLTNDKWGFINKNGEMAIEAKYSDVYFFYNGLAAVYIDKKWGFIDKTGKTVIEPAYESIVENKPFNEGLAFVKKVSGDKEWLIIDNQGVTVGKVAGDGEYHCFSEGLAKEYGEKKSGYIDKTGVWAIKPSFLGFDAWSFSEGLAAVKQSKNNGGYIDKTGKYVIKPAYEDVRSFHEGLAAVKVKGKWGFIDKQGKMVIPPQFTYAEDFSEGLAAVESEYLTSSQTSTFLANLEKSLKLTGGKKWGYIDWNGKYVIQPQKLWETPGPFINGLACIEWSYQRHGYINENGEFVIGPFFKAGQNVSDNALLLKCGDMYGFVLFNENK